MLKQILEGAKMYELQPVTGQKSFYGKAKVFAESDGTETLFSYDTPIIKRKPDGSLERLYDGFSATTGKHIKAFCGLNKAGFYAVERKTEVTPLEKAQAYEGTLYR